jgi:hypothetical protein
MSAADPKPENLRTEYSVIGSYTTAMTGARFQTVAIYLAAIGLIVSRGEPSRLTALLMLVVSFGLWVLDLRNRDVLERLGERGSRIESEDWGSRFDLNAKKGGAGFFLDSPVPPRLRFLMTDSLAVPKPFPPWFLTHAFGIDVVFLGVIGYAIALLAGADEWPWVLTALAPLIVGIVLAAVLHRLSKRDGEQGANRAAP